MTHLADQIAAQSQQILDDWLKSCTRGGRISRNTIAIGIVILDHLRQRSPLSETDIISKGGEIRGARGKSLRQKLEKYGIPAQYLKEATARQAAPVGQHLLNALNWGQMFVPLSDEERNEVISSLIETLVGQAHAWLERQSLKLDIDRSHSPTAWVNLVLDHAAGRSGGVVEQHLVGAKLALRFPDSIIANYPAHAADAQTERRGDFEIRQTIYHVTGAPGPTVIDKCMENLQAGLRPVLLVPKRGLAAAESFAEYSGVKSRIAIISIEDFLAVNIIELADGQQRDYFGILQDIVKQYNERLAQVETDMSLQIEVR